LATSMGKAEVVDTVPVSAILEAVAEIQRLSKA